MWKGLIMKIQIRTNNKNTYEYDNVETYSYDRDFVRIHYIGGIATIKKFVDILPISAIESITIFEKEVTNNA